MMQLNTSQLNTEKKKKQKKVESSSEDLPYGVELRNTLVKSCLSRTWSIVVTFSDVCESTDLYSACGALPLLVFSCVFINGRM